MFVLKHSFAFGWRLLLKATIFIIIITCYISNKRHQRAGACVKLSVTATNSPQNIETTIFGTKVKFIVSQSEFCKSHPENIILITSRPGSRAIRKAVRETWSKYLNERFHFKSVFLLGTLNTTAFMQLAQEEQLFHDLIITDLFDAYPNLTLKTAVALFWIVNMCKSAQIIMKVDDDTVVLPHNIKYVIDILKNNPNQILGKRFVNKKPIHQTTSKLYIDESVYSGSTYPAFVSGHGYILTGEVAEKLLQEVLKQHYAYFPLEDVFFTGIIAEVAGVERSGRLSGKFFHTEINASEACLKRPVTVHYVRKINNFFTTYMTCVSAQ